VDLAVAEHERRRSVDGLEHGERFAPRERVGAIAEDQLVALGAEHHDELEGAVAELHHRPVACVQVFDHLGGVTLHGVRRSQLLDRATGAGEPTRHSPSLVQ